MRLLAQAADELTDKDAQFTGQHQGACAIDFVEWIAHVFPSCGK